MKNYFLFCIISFSSLIGCPDCSISTVGNHIELQTLHAKIAFSWSTLLLITLLILVICFMISIMCSTCRAINRGEKN